MYSRLKYKIFWSIIGIFVLTTICIQGMAFFMYPNEILLLKGGQAKLNSWPGIVSAAEVSNDKVKCVDNKVTAVKCGTTNVEVKAFGGIPLKNIAVEVVENIKLYPSGKLIGMKLKSRGLLVVDLDKVKQKTETIDTLKDVDIKKGDYIVNVNGKKMDTIVEFTQEIAHSSGKYIKIELRRNKQLVKTAIKPVKSDEDNKYHVGVWVREGIAGIGTLTFVNSKNNKFGALGHGIIDSETNSLLDVSYGTIYDANVLGIKKSSNGNPGEVGGVVVEKDELGSVSKNTGSGIFGKIKENFALGKYYPVASRYEVNVGPATILCDLENTGIKEFKINIVSVNPDFVLGNKGFVIEVTDPELLKLTGGIVQGMSGSPVIQNNKIVGAVTHVIINDTKRGYGVFIDSMLKQLNN